MKQSNSLRAVGGNVFSDGKDVPGLEFEREGKEYTINQLKWD